MLRISKPLSAVGVADYHDHEFANKGDQYYSEGGDVKGQWVGVLAQQWQLSGEVDRETFARLAEGRDPHTGDRVVNLQSQKRLKNGKMSAAHRAGWDFTFSAPKSVSVTALVGGDARVRAAHEAAVTDALAVIERDTFARLGGAESAQTGTMIAARFEHDSARPVQGYAAPQVHTHVVVFNMTKHGQRVRPVQPREWFSAQKQATAVYRSSLATRLQALGYRIERGEHGQPEVAGYSKAYLEAVSPRRGQIVNALELAKSNGKRVNPEFVAMNSRESKRAVNKTLVEQVHAHLAREFGDQPRAVVDHAAYANSMRTEFNAYTSISSHDAVAYAVEKAFERESVVDVRTITEYALQRSMGDRTVLQIEQEIHAWQRRGDLLPAPHRSERSLTTPELVTLERSNVRRMAEGQGVESPLVGADLVREIRHRYQHLSSAQAEAVESVLSNRSTVAAFQGAAGVGKTTALAVIAESARRDGYDVRGMAPVSGAVRELNESGVPAITLQRHLASTPSDEESHTRRRLYVLDESSLTSTRQMHEFFNRLQPADRVLLVGDIRQHESVEAGKPYQQMQEAGIAITRLEQIVRQQDPALKAVVEDLAGGRVEQAVATLDATGRIKELRTDGARHRAIARDYATQPGGTLVVSPDNASRVALNDTIHRFMQERTLVSQHERSTRVLVPRQEMTGADRKWAAQYAVGDYLRYTQASAGIAAGSYARVTKVEPHDNRITVVRDSGVEATYDPRRLSGVTVYREEVRKFSVGDRVQFTAPNKAMNIANRELGTIVESSPTHLSIKLDSARQVKIYDHERMHLDYGYAVTSHSSQGQTADRVIIHVDTSMGSTTVNEKFAYVSVSRARFDVTLYTDDKSRVAPVLARSMSHQTAVSKQDVQKIVGHWQQVG